MSKSSTSDNDKWPRGHQVEDNTKDSAYKNLLSIKKADPRKAGEYISLAIGFCDKKDDKFYDHSIKSALDSLMADDTKNSVFNLGLRSMSVEGLSKFLNKLSKSVYTRTDFCRSSVLELEASVQNALPQANSYQLGCIINSLAKAGFEKSDLNITSYFPTSKKMNKILQDDGCNSVHIANIFGGLLNFGLVGRKFLHALEISSESKERMMDKMRLSNESLANTTLIRFEIYCDKYLEEGFFGRENIKDLARNTRVLSERNPRTRFENMTFDALFKNDLGYTVSRNQTLNYKNIPLLHPDFILQKDSNIIYIEADGPHHYRDQVTKEDPTYKTRVRDRIYDYFIEKDANKNLRSHLLSIPKPEDEKNFSAYILDHIKKADNFFSEKPRIKKNPRDQDNIPNPTGADFKASSLTSDHKRSRH